MRHKSQSSWTAFQSKHSRKKRIPNSIYWWKETERWNHLHVFIGFIGELQEAPAKESTVASPPIFWLKHLPNIAADVFWMRLERRLFFFNVSYELKMRNISLLFTTERNTRKHSVMQKISDARICPVCSQSFFLTVLPPGCKVSLTEESLALSPWAESQIWCTHITDLPRGTQCSTDLEMSAVAKTSSFAHVIIKYS